MVGPNERRHPVIDSALFDVACPVCDAGPLELCTVRGRYMESTVHFPRRVRADVPFETPTRDGVGDPTKCKSGLHDWTPENIRTYSDGRPRCHPCAADRQRRNKTKKKVAA